MANKKTEHYKYPIWLWVIFGVLVALNLPFSIIAAAIFFIVKPYFENWAKKINRTPITPFVIVMILGLLGFLIYWIYYKQKISKKR